MLGGTGAWVVTEIENVHRVFGCDPIISPFEGFSNLRELFLKDFSTLLRDNHMLLLSAVS